jgi:hypothetical protein
MQPHEYMADSEDIRRLMNQRRSKLANNYNMRIHNAIEGPVKAVTDRIVDEILYEFRSRLSAEITNIVTVELSKLLDVAEEKQPEPAPIIMTPLYNEERCDAALTDATLPDWWSTRMNCVTQATTNDAKITENTNKDDVIVFTRPPRGAAKEPLDTNLTPLMYSSADLLN